MSRKILLVDDDKKIRLLLKQVLEKNFYDVNAAQDGKSFLAEFNGHEDEYSLVILDVMLPDTDGFALCQTVRRKSDVPIIMLTASAEDTDRIIGLELGADDYIAKPFNSRELVARIKAILRRTAVETAAPPRYYHFLGFVMDAAERNLTGPTGETISLSGLDFQLLMYFVEHAGKILDRRILCEQTRGRDIGTADRTLDVQISRLRIRLNDDGKQPVLIKTVRGVGYVFSADVTSSQNAIVLP